MGRLIRHQLDIYGTMLRLAYDDKTWRAMVRDYPEQPTNMHPLEPPRRWSGMTYEIVWCPTPRKRQSAQTVQHIGLWINHTKLAHDQAGLVSTVAHEAVHAAAHIYDKISADQPPVTAGEPFAYLVDWLVEWIWDNLP